MRIDKGKRNYNKAELLTKKAEWLDRNAYYHSRELIRNGWTRHEMFEEILSNNPPRDYYQPGDMVIAVTRFGPHRGVYCYNCLDNIYRPGDMVIVDVGGEPKVVTVESIG